MVVCAIGRLLGRRSLFFTIPALALGAIGDSIAEGFDVAPHTRKGIA